jgi:hypothetical protein
MIGRSYPVWGHVNISITLLDMIGRSKTNEMNERIHSMTQRGFCKMLYKCIAKKDTTASNFN